MADPNFSPQGNEDNYDPNQDFLTPQVSNSSQQFVFTGYKSKRKALNDITNQATPSRRSSLTPKKSVKKKLKLESDKENNPPNSRKSIQPKISSFFKKTPLNQRLVQSTLEQYFHKLAPVAPIEVYPMTKTPRGYALIFSMETFYKRPKLIRKGTSVDVQNLKGLFNDLKIIPEVHKDLPKKDMCKAIHQFVTKPEQNEAEIAIVVILSHGGDEGIHSIRCHDNRFIDVEKEVFPYFNAKNCTGLHEKPKLFLVQACRGEKFNVDYPLDSDTVSDGYASTDGPQLQVESSIRDASIVYAAVPYFVSLRCEEKGSYLVQCFCHVFRNHAHEDELRTLLQKVSREMAQIESEFPHRHEIIPVRSIPEEKTVLFNKKLYFNVDLRTVKKWTK